jgi:serine/threonine-protein kinase HipA
MQLTFETYWQGDWHQSATLTLLEGNAGHHSACRFEYEINYFIGFAAVGFDDETNITDARALSARHPVNLLSQPCSSWPAFLLDLMPQGYARRGLSTDMGLKADDPATELSLLLRTSGNPIGNIRIREAAELETERLEGITPIGLSEEDILMGSPALDASFDQCISHASSAIGLQGEWPKIALTQAKDGLFYPDAFVGNDNATQHVIVKRPRSSSIKDRLILQAEAGYSRLAQHLGLQVHAPSTYGNDTLIIPRFDRRIEAGKIMRYGQESMVSALGVSAFGHLAQHEDYIDLLKRHSTDPDADILEYVKRDIANRAFGNPDNHGRNTALSKAPDGSIRLSPLFDFAPMRLADDGIIKSTRWRAMQATHSDASPNWRKISQVIYPDEQSAAAQLHYELCLFAEKLLNIGSLSDFGVPQEVIELVKPSQMTAPHEVLKTA